jgi:hypothetical protein
MLFCLPHSNTHTGHIVLLDSVTFIIFDVAYQSCSSSLGRFFQLLTLRCIEGFEGGSVKERARGRSRCRKNHNIKIGLYTIGWNGVE